MCTIKKINEECQSIQLTLKFEGLLWEVKESFTSSCPLFKMSNLRNTLATTGVSDRVCLQKCVFS